jgi:L-ascorbate metabolism protein UlaG (beta-lactamase superfamily)
LIEPLLSDDAFLADIASVPRALDRVDLWWLGQSGFLLQNGDIRALIDPYLSDSLTKKYANTDKPHVRMSRRVIDPAHLTGIMVITASHGHTDHLDAETLRELRKADRQSPKPSNPSFVAPRAIESLARERWGGNVDWLINDCGTGGWETTGGGSLRMTAVPSAHEDVARTEEGLCLYLGYLFQLGGFTLYHSGDTVLYEGMVERLRPFNIDVALLPINGRAPERRVAGNLNGREAAWLAKEIGARVVIPCHYNMFEFNTATPDEFVAECERLGQPYRVLQQGERWSLCG